MSSGEPAAIGPWTYPKHPDGAHLPVENSAAVHTVPIFARCKTKVRFADPAAMTSCNRAQKEVAGNATAGIFQTGSEGRAAP
jgi:hypothetical protein